VAAEAIRADFRKLARDPSSREVDVKKLEPKNLGQYRLRHGKWRAVFERDKTAKRLEVAFVDDRKDVY